MAGMHRALIVGLGGCGNLFSLQPIEPAPNPDAAVISPLDEDGDDISNDDDVCPTVADPMQLDVDKDGVGDACDPHPSLKGDRVVAQALFAGDTIDGGWTPNVSGWSVADGVLANTEPLVLRLDLGGTGTYPAIEIGYTARAYSNGLASVRVSVETGSTYIACHVDYNAPEFIAFLGPSFASLSDTKHRVVLVADDTGARCTVNGMLGTSPDQIPSGTTDAIVELVDQMRVDIAYLVAYTSSP